MQKKEDLIQENIELRARLDLAKKWMRRQVASSIAKIQKESAISRTRGNMNAVWKENGVDIITGKILHQFDSVLQNAPKYTLERLIDAEIYWHTLQEYPHMDALPIVLAYQKIFDAWIEELLIAPWRNINHTTTHHSVLFSREIEILERDVENILSKKYTLSIGRLYQILSLIRSGTEFPGNLGNLVFYWKNAKTTILDGLVSENFFVLFSEIMKREVWSKKRHESKVNYTDAKIARETLIGTESSKDSLFHILFSFK